MAMKKIVLPVLLLAITPFCLWCVPACPLPALDLLQQLDFGGPAPARLYCHLFFTPLVWGMIALLLPGGRQWPNLLGQRKWAPFVWIPGLLALSIGFLGVGYIGNLVTFSYGLTRPQVLKTIFLPMFLATTVAMTLGVERPLRQVLLKENLLKNGVPLAAAMGFCALLGTLRSLPFYWTDWPDPRCLSFSILNLFILEFTLNRLYLVSGNLLACGIYHSLVVILVAFVFSDVLGPYLPAFHWVSSSTAFYLWMSLFNLLPYLILSFIRIRQK